MTSKDSRSQETDHGGAFSFKALPLQERVVLFLRDVLDYSRRDVSLLVGISDVQADRLLSLARRRLASGTNRLPASAYRVRRSYIFETVDSGKQSFYEGANVQCHRMSYALKRRTYPNGGEADLPWIKPSLDFGIHSASFEAEEAHQRDERLVSAAKTGSNTAFSELFSLYSKRILKRTLSITGNMQDAEDAMQDTFLKAFVHLKQFDGRSKFYTWLTRVAINSSIMFLRKRRTRRETSFEIALSIWTRCIYF